ncbi:hypothetical protein [Sinorhizobium meliloti]|uniref:hypothetical protein n=1 Tax=Rhizobium meliloti TaxID=382 RepID=UPI000FD80737|nr:hypothetical protein [Sinorhizobium meliloti]RVO68364.1 hypothetical protein CN087_12885 [Sinorhizobium meliloti]
MENIWAWVAIAVAAYAFVPVFRREVNSWIVKLADKVKDDTLENPKVKGQPELHFLEDVAFRMFERDNPGDPRIAGGWNSLPPEVRKEYITKAIDPLVGPEESQGAAAIQPQLKS